MYARETNRLSFTEFDCVGEHLLVVRPTTQITLRAAVDEMALFDDEAYPLETDVVMGEQGKLYLDALRSEFGKNLLVHLCTYDGPVTVHLEHSRNHDGDYFAVPVPADHVLGNETDIIVFACDEDDEPPCPVQ
jgi:hypothetical protein